ncbi:hypothetical protein [Nocardia brasiliensis]
MKEADVSSIPYRDRAEGEILVYAEYVNEKFQVQADLPSVLPLSHDYSDGTTVRGNLCNPFQIVYP